MEDRIQKNAQMIEEILLQEKDTLHKKRKLYALTKLNEYSMAERLEILEFILHHDEMVFDHWFRSEFDASPSKWQN
jgi:hypothetical protein